ncbi:MAG: ribonuclease R [Lewinellaceae bacterium]|nr:ribonuclease R [Lewinella sp.]MCB9277296.1 ribonuclease R [Lewinellaceae bacterium]
MTKKKGKKIKGAKLSAKELQSEILKLFRRSPKKQLNPKQVVQKLKADNNKDSVLHALQQLAEAGELISLEDYKFKIAKKEAAPPKQGGQVLEGIVDMTRSGDAYIVVRGRPEDIHVSARYLNTAMHGDRVQIKAWRPGGRRKHEGEVLKIVERATKHYLGTLTNYPKYAIVQTDPTPFSIDIIINTADTKGAKTGDKVVVSISNWPQGKFSTPEGRVETVLGAAGSHDIEMKAILINNGFDLEFAKETLEETELLPDRIQEAEIALRRDFRPVTTFTIDPDNAKDFDDALSYRVLENGQIEIGVHIADVSHYVHPGTALDKEALQRSTSVYLVDRVLPMLPEKLSNELCSLRPNEDKLTFSAVFTFDQRNRITGRWFGKTVIHSDRRFTYEEVQEILDAGEGEYCAELKKLNELAISLRKKRFRHGSINFETDEVKFKLDENGAPIEVFVKERKEAHMLIEDFMLLANREVATFIAQKGKDYEIPFIYRVHDEPDPDKVGELARFAHELGFKMKVDTPQDIARSFNALTREAAKNPALKLLEPLAIRTMAKAEYTSENIGHYGLGFDYYTHFTSPIRRYSDVLSHRILERNLGEGNFYRMKKDKLEEECGHISKQERRAMDAERESVKYKQVEYLEKHVGDTFKGMVSGIAERGFFVQLKDNFCEGFVLFESLGETFEPTTSRLRIIGRRTGKELKMGDDIEVKVLSTDLSKRRVELEWIEQSPNQKQPAKQRGRRPAQGGPGQSKGRQPRRQRPG